MRTTLPYVAAALLACGPDGARTITEEGFVREYAAAMCAQDCGPVEWYEPYGSCEAAWEASATDAMNGARALDLEYDAACAAEVVDEIPEPGAGFCDYVGFGGDCSIYYGNEQLGAACEDAVVDWSYSTCASELLCNSEHVCVMMPR